MTTSKHSVALNITGNAKRYMEDLARKMKNAGRTISDSFKKASESAASDELMSAVDQMENMGKSAERSAKHVDNVNKRVTQSMGRRGGGVGGALPTAVQVGGRAAGGDILGAAGGAAGAVGGKLGAGTLLGGGMIAAGIAASFVSSFANKFDPVIEQLGQISGRTGKFSISKMQDEVVAAVSGRAVTPSMVRQIVAITSRVTGKTDFGRGADISELARATGNSAEALADFVSFQERFGTGLELEEAMGRGLESGLKAGQIGESLASVKSLQEQALNQGVVDTGQSAKMLQQLGEIDKGTSIFKGRVGAQLLAGVGQQITGAGRGQGGILTAALFRGLKDMPFLEKQREAAKGIAGGGFDAIMEVLKSMGRTDPKRIQAIAAAFKISPQQAEVLLKLSRLRSQSDKAAFESGRTQLQEQLKNYRASETADKVQTRKTTEKLKEKAGETSSKIKDFVLSAFTKEGRAVGAFLEKSGIRPPFRGIQEEKLVGEEQAETFKQIAKEAKFDTQKELERALYNVNVQRKLDPDISKITKEEYEAGFINFIERFERAMEKSGKQFDFNFTINGKKITTGSVSEDAGIQE